MFDSHAQSDDRAQPADCGSSSLPARAGRGRHSKGKVEYPQEVDGLVLHGALPHGCVFIHALTGPHDSGQACKLLTTHLLDTLQHERLITFNADDFVLYSANRPAISLIGHTYIDYEPIEIGLDRVRDDEGHDFLLLHGPEPDLNWEHFSSSIAGIMTAIDTPLSIGCRAVAMTIPHTRPVHVLEHGNTDDISSDEDTEQVHRWPASMSATLEFKIGAAGTPSVGFTAGVPFYAQNGWYPQAGSELVRRISARSGLALPLGDLEAAHAQAEGDIAAQVAQDENFAHALRLLEEGYDEKIGDDAQLPNVGDVPSADEIGAAAEAFLADLMRDHRPADPPGESSSQ